MLIVKSSIFSYASLVVSMDEVSKLNNIVMYIWESLFNLYWCAENMVVMPIATSLSMICWRSSFKWDHCSFFKVLLWALVLGNSVFYMERRVDNGGFLREVMKV
jgi:hypothetical protein